MPSKIEFYYVYIVALDILYAFIYYLDRSYYAISLKLKKICYKAFKLENQNN